MALQLIDLTTPQPGGKFGDPTKTAWQKVNDNSDYLEERLQQLAIGAGDGSEALGAIQELQDSIDVVGNTASQAVPASTLLSTVGATLVGFIDTGVGAVLRTLDSLLKERLTPERYGAVAGLDVSPEQRLLNTEAFNNCLAVAATRRSAMKLSGGSYEVDTTNTPILHPSRVPVLGNDSSVIAKNDNAPIWVSKSYWDSGAPAGRMRIYNLTVSGTDVGAEQHGIVVRDYYSTLWGVTVANVGGRGIFFNHLSRTGVSTTGTLVEPRIIDCTVNLSGRSCFYLGASNNNKITDGYLKNCIARLSPGATEARIVCGASAGWDFDGVHTYGGSPASAVILANFFNSHIGFMYNEDGWTQYALDMPNYQRNGSIDSLAISAASAATGANAAAVRLSRSTAFAQATLNINSLCIHADSGSTLSAIRNENAGSLSVSLANTLRVTGNGAVSTPGISDDWFTSSVTGLKASSNGKILYYRGYGVPLSKSVTANGAGQKVCSFDVPYLGLSAQAVVDVVVHARQNTNGTPRASYVGKAVINTKAEIDAWVVRMLDIVPPSGFAADPSGVPIASVLKGADGTGVLSITFTYANSDAFGGCNFMMPQS